jgi:hypothetical protein
MSPSSSTSSSSSCAEPQDPLVSFCRRGKGETLSQSPGDGEAGCEFILDGSVLIQL